MIAVVLAGIFAAPLTVVGGLITFAGWLTARIAQRYPERATASGDLGTELVLVGEHHLAATGRTVRSRPQLSPSSASKPTARSDHRIGWGTVLVAGLVLGNLYLWRYGRTVPSLSWYTTTVGVLLLGASTVASRSLLRDRRKTPLTPHGIRAASDEATGWANEAESATSWLGGRRKGL